MALNPPLTRRQLLGVTASAALWASGYAQAASPAQSKRKLAFVLLRGAADGLSLLAPVGDPQFVSARGAIADEAGRHQVNDFFALHPALKGISDIAKSNDALLFHAVGLTAPTRSHFDAQNLLETGGKSPYASKTGVLNRMLSLNRGDAAGLALSQAIPPALQGSGSVSSYAPNNRREGNADLYSRIARMYGDQDSTLARVWSDALNTSSVGREAQSTDGPGSIGTLAANFLTSDRGFDVVMIESIGWDTHSNQHGRLARQAADLDHIILNLKAGLGAAWADTLVIIASEFGRTVATNGNGGTDHGTAGVLFALGGALPSSGVKADWPGLAKKGLFEGRDLATTTPVESVISALAGQHYGVAANEAARILYPQITLPRSFQL